MEVFDPVKYSLAENKFFLTHLGESPVVALEETLPKGVNPTEVQAVLGAVFELQELEEHRGKAWVGTEALRKSIRTYLHEAEKWRDLALRGAPRFPTMHAWDGKGRPHRGGIGSDANQVTTWLDEDGTRHPFKVSMHEQPIQAAMPWTKEAEPIPDAYIHDEEKGVIQCPIDGWSTNYNPDSRSAFNVAHARMARHCKASKDERVREFGMKVFN
tara:strand:+ start:1552 stop:2193 length:642 start_codon:yes stop_codon:yes gene_type:complete